MDIYAENILDHYKNPRHKMPLASPTVEHEEANHSCGDTLAVQLQLENGRIAHLGWRGDGCAISQAGMSLMSEHLVGMPISEVMKLGKREVYNLLGVSIGPRRVKCALMCLHTVKNALHKAGGQPAQSWIDTVEIEDE